MAGYTLKEFFSRDLVRRLAGDIHRVHPDFPAKAFISRAGAGLEDLELLDRARHLARVLAQFLPPAYPEAIDVLLRSLGPEHESDELLGVGMAPFYYMPHVLFVAERGLDHFDLSMRAQYELTKRFSAESSIRFYIDQHPERTFAILRRWIGDENAHVRRLVSEGTRLRLPWAPRVRWLDEHPERVLELLELLKDDPSTMVRRSVANNLNDLGKVHPELLARTCASWRADTTAERRALIEHALRSAIKRGDPDALRLLGFGGRAAVAVEGVEFRPSRVAIGGRVSMTFILRSTSKKSQDLLVDVAVHFVKARGDAKAKVFKLKSIELPPRGRAAFETAFSLAVHTTRVPQPGTHAVDVLVNGKPYRAGSFEVTPNASRRRRSQ
ncbi:MAG TPA: DNA alkylation repair protein [Thermoanaerobaculia bacterium]|nr:DNA alkylation repair protein [Thermoanaerobaculia bacterium]